MTWATEAGCKQPGKVTLTCKVKQSQIRLYTVYLVNTHLYSGCQVSMWPPPQTTNWCPQDHFLSFLPPVSLRQSAPAWSDSEATGNNSGFDTNCDVPALAKYNNNYSPWHPCHSKWPWEAAATVPTPVLAGNKMVVASTFSWSALSMSSGSVWRMLITKINIIVYNWRVENANLKMVKYPKLKLHNYNYTVNGKVWNFPKM